MWSEQRWPNRTKQGCSTQNVRISYKRFCESCPKTAKSISTPATPGVGAGVVGFHSKYTYSGFYQTITLTRSTLARYSPNRSCPRRKNELCSNRNLNHVRFACTWCPLSCALSVRLCHTCLDVSWPANSQGSTAGGKSRLPTPLLQDSFIYSYLWDFCSSNTAFSLDSLFLSRLTVSLDSLFLDILCANQAYGVHHDRRPLDLSVLVAYTFLACLIDCRLAVIPVQLCICMSSLYRLTTN